MSYEVAREIERKRKTEEEGLERNREEGEIQNLRLTVKVAANESGNEMEERA